MFGFAPHLLISDFQVQTNLFTYQIGLNQIALSNPDRYAICFWGQPSAAIFIGPSNLVAQNIGFNISDTVVPYIFKFPDWGPVVCGNWFGFASGFSAAGLITEIIYKPNVE